MSKLLVGALLAGALSVASGCVSFASPLPTATATLHWATIDLPRGSYCWSSGGHGECADSAGPDALLSSGYLKPYVTGGGFDATIAFHGASEPSRFEVELVRSPGDSSTQVRASARHSFSVGASPPQAAGLYVYVVTGTWAEGDVSFYLTLQLVPGVASAAPEGRIPAGRSNA